MAKPCFHSAINLSKNLRVCKSSLIPSRHNGLLSLSKSLYKLYRYRHEKHNSNLQLLQKCFYTSSGQNQNQGINNDAGSGSNSASEPQSTPNLDAKDAEFYDIIIAGGGLVGAAMAVALGQLGRLSNKRILLLEAADKLWSKPPDKNTNDANYEPNYSNRVIALSPGSKSLLSKLKIWENIWRSQTVSNLQVWDALSDANISLHNPNFTEPIAHIVENAVLAHAIDVSLKEVRNVTVKFGSKLKTCQIPSLNKPGDKSLVALQNDELLSTDLLIGADGYNSKVRSSINSPYLGFNYDRTAVVATLQIAEAAENHVAWQRFLPSGGPIALLPLSPEYSSLVWSTTPKYAKTLLEMSSDDFVDAVNSAFWTEHTRSELVKKSCEILSSFNLGGTGPKIFPPSIMQLVEKSRASFPLGFGHSSYYVSRRAVLIGDAAHRVHPLAGQGLNLGLGDVDALQRILNNIVGIGEDIGNLEMLKDYETERQRHNLAIQSGIDFLHRLYSYEFAPVVALRTIGLSLVNSSDMMKRAIISQAAA